MDVDVIPWDGARPPTERALRDRLETEGYEVFLWSDGPGAVYTPHAHRHDESIWVVAGEISFGIGGRTFRLGPGDRLLLPRGTVHTAAAGAGGATYLVGERPS
jgi:quercetin dioxygenase-like cupin family protein